jgi:hypothetical protein
MLENERVRAHIRPMGRVLVLALVSLALAGCSRWDEAKERAACAQLHPGEPVKADDCFNKNKLAYDQGWAGWARSLAR